jgi:hypothetical protein
MPTPSVGSIKQIFLAVLLETSDFSRRHTSRGNPGCCSSVLESASHDWTMAACHLGQPGYPFYALGLGLYLPAPGRLQKLWLLLFVAGKSSAEVIYDGLTLLDFRPSAMWY